jgi:MerR family transcriptional regulator, light-induced transcriptional regulator
MHNKSSPKKHSLPQHTEAGHVDVGSDWSAALSEMHIAASNHVSMRNKPAEEKAKAFHALLNGVVEGQVIPRLMLAHKSAGAAQNRDPLPMAKIVADIGKAVDPLVVEPFAKLVLSGSVEDLEDFVVEITRGGSSSQSIYLDLMAPAARLLGQYWEDDLCSFVDVTMGLGRLQTLLYRLSATQDREADLSDQSPKALFLTPEGSQHSLGVRMIEELFRNSGWRTACEINTPLIELVNLVSHETFDLVGISLSTEGQVELAREIIRQIRLASLNPKVQVILGGKLVADDPNLAMRLGADLAARDGKEAILIADKLFHKSPPRFAS